jgi:hypothetical protein
MKPWSLPPPESALPESVAQELVRHVSEAEYRAKRHRKRHSRHSQFVYALGIPAGTLAVVAGSTALAGAPAFVTALVAFGSAASTTALAVVDPVTNRVDHGRKEAAFLNFARKARVALLKLERMSPTEQVALLEELNDQRYRLDDRSPTRSKGDGPPPDSG